MKNFAIRDIENLSGIKSHTLRIWELRYDFIKPRRNEVNFRYYTIDEVGRLLDIALLTKNGYRISHVSSMDHDEVLSRVYNLSNDEDQQQKAVNDLIVSMYTLNPEAFEATIDQCMKKWPAITVMKSIILVFLKKTGLMWQGSRLTEEHFVVTIIRKKIIAAIDQLKEIPSRQKLVLLYLPEGKQLDLVLLYTHYLLKSKGIMVLYMGTDVTFDNLKTVVQLKQPDVVFTYLHQKNQTRCNEVCAWLLRDAPHSKIIITTYPEQEITSMSEKKIFMAYEDAINLMSGI